MFVCKICGTVMPPRTKPKRVVTKKRARHYPHRRHVHKVMRGRRTDWRDDPGGQGWEILEEVLACTSCATDRDNPGEEETEKETEEKAE